MKQLKDFNFQTSLIYITSLKTWAGRAECHLYEGAMTAYSIDDYVKLYDDSISIRYHIGKAKYYALRFNGRGVFLVSEKRYNELKAYK